MVPVLNFLKNNWMSIAGALIVIALVMIFMSMRKEKYYDYEMAGCQTCSAGDAGVFDHEEMYQSPDDYYSDAENDEIYEEDEIYEDDTFAGDDAENMVFAEEVVDGDAEEVVDGDAENMVFAEEVIDGDAEEDVDMLEIDELDAEKDEYAEL